MPLTDPRGATTAPASDTSADDTSACAPDEPEKSRDISLANVWIALVTIAASSLAAGVFTLLAGRQLRYLGAAAGAAVLVLTALVTTDATLKDTPWARRLTVITAGIGAGATVSVGTVAGDGSKLVGALVGAIVVFVILGGYLILHCIEQRHRT